MTLVTDQSTPSVYSTSGTTHQSCYMLIFNIESTFTPKQVMMIFYEQRLCQYLSSSSHCVTFTWLLELQRVTSTMISKSPGSFSSWSPCLKKYIYNYSFVWRCLFTNPGFCSPSALLFSYLFCYDLLSLGSSMLHWQYGMRVRMVTTKICVCLPA